MKKETKKFIPCIYLHNQKAVRSLTDSTVVEEDPLRLVQLCNEHNADELIVFDLSEEDGEHEANLDVLKAICAAAEMDVIGAGNVKRMEDVKKILYTGCKYAILDYDRESNIAITEEVSQKFGKDKILLSCKEPAGLAQHREAIGKYVSGMVLMDHTKIEEAAETIDLPFYVYADETALESLCLSDGQEDTGANGAKASDKSQGDTAFTARLSHIFANDKVCGITGVVVNDHIGEILSWKEFCVKNDIPVETLKAAYAWSDLKLNSDGMVPVVVQDYRTAEVLMVAYMNEEAYLETLRTGKMTYYSRSRQELWLKGATSGHFQYVKSLTADCDMDTILAKVSQVGAACHTGAKSCFFHEIARKEYQPADNPLQVFEEVFDVIKDRKVHPKEGSYTNYLFDKGIDKILKKLGEEATEIVIAAKNPNANEIKYEISDFLYHMMVLMAEKDVTWEEITTELANR